LPSRRTSRRRWRRRWTIALAAPDRAEIAQPATSNLDAYDEFLKGEQITNSLGSSDGVTLLKGLEHYERALQLDSTFVRAWSAVARAQSGINGSGPTKEGVERARVAAERTVQLAPNRVEARLAMGSYLRAIKVDLTGARQQFLAGLERDPNNPDLLTELATVERALGRFDDALAHAKQAALVDPRSVASARRLAAAYQDLRRYPEALQAYDRALALSPENLAMIQGKAIVFVSLGRLDSVHALVHEKLKTIDTTALVVRFSLYQEMMWDAPGGTVAEDPDAHRQGLRRRQGALGPQARPHLPAARRHGPRADVRRQRTDGVRRAGA
jgi:tetratricopeptide (TPR) repeat protein